MAERAESDSEAPKAPWATDLQQRLSSLAQRARGAREEQLPHTPPPPLPTPPDPQWRLDMVLDRFTHSIGPEHAPAEGANLDEDRKRALYERWEFDRNVLLAGVVGAGKTWTAVAMCKKAIKAGRLARFAPTGRTLTDLGPYGDETLRKRLITVDVLLLDALGDEPIAGDSRSGRLLDILDERWRHRRPVLATSNYPARQMTGYSGQLLADRIGTATTDRLLDGADGVYLAGPSRRSPRRTR